MMQVRAITKSERCVIMFIPLIPREYSTDWRNHQPRMRDCRLVASRADLHLLRLRWRFLRSKIDAVGQLAKAVITMLHGLIADDDHAQPGFVAALRHADRPGD